MVQRRLSRDAAASTIGIDTQGTLPALVGTVSSRRPRMTSPPVPRIARNCTIIGTRFRALSTLCLSDQSARINCPAVTGLNLVCIVLGSQPIAARNSLSTRAQLCLQRTLGQCTEMAHLRVGPQSVSSGDWPAPEFTTSLGELPTGARFLLADRELWHAVHRTRPRGSISGHGEGDHARSSA